jgi:ABC-type multidrug transport system ATPase subunit/ABC-type multidrug transport system permease subunit
MSASGSTSIRLAQRRSAAAADGKDHHAPIARYASQPLPNASPASSTEEEDDDTSPSEDTAPSVWDRVRANWKGAAQAIASAGLLSSAPASALEGTSGSSRMDQRNVLARVIGTSHGKQRGQETAGEIEDKQLRASYEEHSEQRQHVQEPEQEEVELSGMQIGGPQFHEEEDSRGAEESKEAVDLEKGLQRRASSQVVTDNATARLQKRLANISDPDVRALLDPNSKEYASEAELLKWPDEKLIELVKNFDLSDMEAMLTKLKKGQMISANTPLSAEDLTTSLSWRNLSYSVDGVTMLQNLSGYVRPGQLVAVLGGPDAGITTLLDVLAHRTRGRGEVLGEMYVNRRPLDASFGRQVGYVTKRDIHLPQLTVSETLYFSARLRNPGLSGRGATLRVALTMKLLGLLHCWKTPIGDDIVRGISGGEKRRVSFGLELVAGHNLILADLPTNGLDAGSALSLIQVYKSTTLIGRSLLCSLVQPSPAIFAMLDFVLVLSKGANIYFGPADLAEKHFASLGFDRPKEKSVPQWLEELSAAPEKFAGKQSIGMRINTANAFKSQRPLALLREREERLKKDRARLITSSTSFADAAISVHEAVHSVPTFELHPQNSPDPLLPDDFSPDTDSSAAMRVNAWKALVNGFQSSVFNDDIGWVLYNELTPLPVFREDKRIKKRKKKPNKNQLQRDQQRSIERDTQVEIEMATRNAQLSHPPGTVEYETAVRAMQAEVPTRKSKQTSVSTTTSPHKPFDRYSPHVTSFTVQFIENLARMCVLFYRNRALWLLNYCKSLFIGLTLGTLFYMLSLSQSNVRTRFGLFYFALTFNTANSQQLVPVMLSFRKVFQLQKEGMYYRPLAYYFSLICVNIPIAVIESFIFLIIVYPLAGLHGGISSAQFGYCYLMIILVNLVSRSWVILLAALTPTEALMNILNGISLVVFSIFSGYLNPRDSIPPFSSHFALADTPRDGYHVLVFC